LSKLQAANVQLKQQLKDMCEQVDAVLTHISKTAKDSREEAVTRALRAKDEELRNAHKRLEIYRRDIAALKRQLDENGNIERVLALESEVKQRERQLEQLMRDNKGLQRVQRQQERALADAAHANAEIPTRIRQLNEELRRLKVENHALKAKQQEMEQAAKKQHGQCIDLEGKLRKYTLLLKGKIDVTDLQSHKAKSPPPHEVPSEELERLSRDLQTVREARSRDEAKNKRAMRVQEAELKVLHGQIEELDAQLRAKDNEYRMNQVKLNEMRRLLRQHNVRGAHVLVPSTGAAPPSAPPLPQEGEEEVLRAALVEKEHSKPSVAPPSMPAVQQSVDIWRMQNDHLHVQQSYEQEDFEDYDDMD